MDLILAARSGDRATVKSLLLRGSSSNVEVSAGTERSTQVTPLIAAIVGRNSEIVSELVNSGAYPTGTRGKEKSAAQNGWTPVHFALASRQTAVCNLLVSKGAKLDTPDRSGRKPAELLFNAEEPFPHHVTSNRNAKSFSWGSNASLCLGYGTSVAQLVPKIVPNVQEISMVAAHSTHAAAVSHNGDMYTWGLGHGGKLGIGSDTESSVEPVLVRSLSGNRLIAVACGRSHTVALSATGTVYTFGSNESGQQACPDNKLIHNSPRSVKALKGKHVIQIAAGDAFTLALTNDGDVYGWGSNNKQQLYAQSREDVDPSLTFGVPRRLDTADKHVTMIACGSHHSVILTDQGTLHVWGFDRPGPWRLLPKTVVRTAKKAASDFDTVNPGKARFVAVNAGFTHTVAIAHNGDVFYWPEATANSEAYLWDALSTRNVVQVACGKNHFLARTAAGQCYGWGSCHAGQLGVNEVDTDVGADAPRRLIRLKGVTHVTAADGFSFATVAGFAPSRDLPPVGSSMFDELKVMLEEDAFSTCADVLIEHPAGALNAHACILSLRAPSLLEGSIKNANDGVYVVRRFVNANREVLKALLRYLYLGVLQWGEGMLGEFVNLAEQAGLTQLAAALERHMVSQSEDSNEERRVQLMVDLQRAFDETVGLSTPAPPANPFGTSPMLGASPQIYGSPAKGRNKVAAAVDTTLVGYDDLSFMFTDTDPPILASRALVSARCEVLRVMLQAPMREGSTGVVRLGETVKPATFRRVLEYFYTDDVRDIDTLPFDVCSDLLAYAHSLMLTRLVQLAEDGLAGKLTLRNVPGLLECVDAFDAHRLKANCLRFVDFHYEAFVTTGVLAELRPETLEQVDKYLAKQERIMDPTWERVSTAIDESMVAASTRLSAECVSHSPITSDYVADSDMATIIARLVGETTDSETERFKRVRALRKKLLQIATIEERAAAGEKLTPEQEHKAQQRGPIQEALDMLLATLPAVPPSPSAAASLEPPADEELAPVPSVSSPPPPPGELYRKAADDTPVGASASSNRRKKGKEPAPVDTNTTSPPVTSVASPPAGPPLKSPASTPSKTWSAPAAKPNASSIRDMLVAADSSAKKQQKSTLPERKPMVTIATNPSPTAAAAAPAQPSPTKWQTTPTKTSGANLRDILASESSSNGPPLKSPAMASPPRSGSLTAKSPAGWGPSPRAKTSPEAPAPSSTDDAPPALTLLTFSKQTLPASPNSSALSDALAKDRNQAWNVKPAAAAAAQDEVLFWDAPAKAPAMSAILAEEEKRQAVKSKQALAGEQWGAKGYTSTYSRFEGSSKSSLLEIQQTEELLQLTRQIDEATAAAEQERTPRGGGKRGRGRGRGGGGGGQARGSKGRGGK